MAPGFTIQQVDAQYQNWISASTPTTLSERYISTSDFSWESASSYENPAPKKKLTTKEHLDIQRNAFSGFYSKPVYRPKQKTNKREPLQRVDKFKTLNENLII